MTRVLFVCLGNICRSPAAEGVLLHLAAKAGVDDRWHVDSAGILDMHTGDAADPRMRAAAARRGYRLESRARQVRADDFLRFDLILAMDLDNLEALRALAPKGATARVRLFGEYVDAAAPPEVPDPYFGGPDGFERVLDLLEAGCAELLATSPRAVGR